MDKFSKLPNDILVYMALNMDFPEIISLCKTSKSFNLGVCHNSRLWIQKLKKDYNINFNEIRSTVASPIDFYKMVKAGIFSSSDEYNDFFKEDAHSLYETVIGTVSDETIGLIVEEMFKQSGEYDPSVILKDKIYYIIYNFSSHDQTSGYALVENPDDIFTDNIKPTIQYDISSNVYKDVSFETFHGKSVNDYLDGIKEQLDKIKTKNTVTVETNSPLGEDIYILHRMN